MIIFCDGSTNSGALKVKNKHLLTNGQIKKEKAKKVQKAGFGVVIIDQDQQVELHGYKEINGVDCLHEHIAFLEAVAYAIAHNGNTLNTKIYTDCNQIAFGKMPYKYALHQHLQKAFDKIKHFYSPEVLKAAEQFILFGAVRWLKGHSGDTLHDRADYLSRCGRRVDLPVLTFEKWIKDSSRYDILLGLSKQKKDKKTETVST